MIDITKKKVFIFDLDGTLAESKQVLDLEMASLIKKLLSHYVIAVISGGTLKQFEIQFLPNLELDLEQKKNLLLLPTSGSALYRYTEGGLEKIYEEKLTEKEITRIKQVFSSTLEKIGQIPTVLFGEIIENRGSQVTYSALGQEAPLELKRDWDPDQSKRKQIVSMIEKELSDFQIGIGGATSIDITRKGINKAYGIKRLAEYLNLPISEMLFCGDALFLEGNDWSATETGIDCLKVKDASDTKALIRNILQGEQIPEGVTLEPSHTKGGIMG